LLRNAFGQEVGEALQREWLPACSLASDFCHPLPEGPTNNCKAITSQLRKAASAECSGRLKSPVAISQAQSALAVPKLEGQASG
jgi:hypothetical protein